MKNKFNKKNKKISQKTNINIKINNNDTKRRRRQPNRKRPTTIQPPSYNNMPPFGMNLEYSQNQKQKIIILYNLQIYLEL